MGVAIKIPSKDRWSERSLPARQEAVANWSRPLRTRLGRGGARAVLGGGEAAYKGPRGFLERPQALEKSAGYSGAAHLTSFFFFTSLVKHNPLWTI